MKRAVATPGPGEGGGGGAEVRGLSAVSHFSNLPECHRNPEVQLQLTSPDGDLALCLHSSKPYPQWPTQAFKKKKKKALNEPNKQIYNSQLFELIEGAHQTKCSEGRIIYDLTSS